MGAAFVVVDPPRFNLLGGILEVKEPVLVEAFLPQPTVERLDERIIGGLARSTKVERRLVEVSPPIQ